MRTHGWAGAATSSDEEAIARILAAAGKSIDERIIQSFVIDPGRPPRSGQNLRSYTRRWVGSAVAHRNQ